MKLKIEIAITSEIHQERWVDWRQFSWQEGVHGKQQRLKVCTFNLLKANHPNSFRIILISPKGDGESTATLYYWVHNIWKVYIPHYASHICRISDNHLNKALFTLNVFSPFFSPFSDGLNEFLWCCLHMTSKYVRKIKGTAGKNGLKNVKCK